MSQNNCDGVKDRNSYNKRVGSSFLARKKWVHYTTVSYSNRGGLANGNSRVRAPAEIDNFRREIDRSFYAYKCNPLACH